MSGPLRLALFALLLGLVFAAAALAGSALDPDSGGGGSSHARDDEGEMKAHADTNEARTQDHGAEAAGLASSAGGLQLVVEDRELEPGTDEVLRFSIVRGGRTVRDFDVAHERAMHLIVVRRDLSGFQHLHPRQRGDGSWEAELRLPAAGSYRLFADFAHAGESYTLGSDVAVPGRFEPRPLPAHATEANADGGYQVRLDRESNEVVFTVTRDGQPVRDLQPYLGAMGHLVALREGDLAFLHVHPEESERRGEIRFRVSYPSRDRYRLYLQFRHDGLVRTAEFTTEPGHAHD